MSKPTDVSNFSENPSTVLDFLSIMQESSSVLNFNKEARLRILLWPSGRTTLPRDFSKIIAPWRSFKT